MSSNQPHAATDEIIAAILSELDLGDEKYESLRAENNRLRAALKQLYDGLVWDWRGHPAGDLPTLREIARTALEGSTV